MSEVNKMSRFYYCPYCGYTKLSKLEEFDPKEKATKETIELASCEPCLRGILLTPAQNKSDYYYNKSVEKYGDDSHWYEFLLEEIKVNPLFNEKLYERAHSPKPIANKNITNNPEPIANKNITNIPKCPTCGSTNIKKISTSSKVFGAAMFGLFSKTAKSQFQCNNCGYKW